MNNSNYKKLDYEFKCKQYSDSDIIDMYNGKCNKGGGFGHQWFKDTNFIRKQMINRFDLYFVGKGLVLHLKKRIVKDKNYNVLYFEDHCINKLPSNGFNTKIEKIYIKEYYDLHRKSKILMLNFKDEFEMQRFHSLNSIFKLKYNSHKRIIERYNSLKSDKK